MALTEGQRIEIRKIVGDSEPTDLVLDEMFDRLGKVDEVMTEVLERRLATWESEPSSFTIVGEYAQQRDAESLARLRAKVSGVGGDAGGYRLGFVPVDYGDFR